MHARWDVFLLGEETIRRDRTHILSKKGVVVAGDLLDTIIDTVLYSSCMGWSHRGQTCCWKNEGRQTSQVNLEKSILMTERFKTATLASHDARCVCAVYVDHEKWLWAKFAALICSGCVRARRENTHTHTLMDIADAVERFVYSLRYFRDGVKEKGWGWIVNCFLL